MTLLAQLCHQAHEYEKSREEEGLTTEGYKRALATYEKSRKQRTLGERDVRPRNPDKVFMGPTLIIWYDSGSDIDSDIYFDICGSFSPVPMVSEWQEAIRSNTLLTPILHYGTSFFDRRAWDQISSALYYPWRH